MFWVRYGPSHSQMELKLRLTEAVRSATNLNYLRPNTVNGLTGENPGDNTGIGVPVFHFEEQEKDELDDRVGLEKEREDREIVRRRTRQRQ